MKLSCLPKHDEMPDLISEIRKYLTSHPAAADTAEGVQLWWLRTGDMSLDVVQTALDRLVVERILEKVKNVDGHVIYKARAARSLDDGRSSDYA